MQNRIRPIAICVFYHEDRILVFEGYDHITNTPFYRPLGGGIEFGEASDDTIRREIKEELGEDVADLQYLFTLENIFSVNGRAGHEIVQVYDGRLINSGLYAQAEMSGTEADGGHFKALWKQLDEFNPQNPLYPDGLLDLLRHTKAKGKYNLNKT